MGIAIIMAAARLAETNHLRAEQLGARHTALQTRIVRERAAQERRRRSLHDDVLVPFRDAFARLTNVDLVDLAEIDPSAASELSTVEAAVVRLRALTTLGAMAGGLGAGAGTGAVAYATRGGALAVASGAAGTTVPGGPAATVSASWHGRRRLRAQRDVGVALTGAEAALARDEARSAAALARGREVRVVLADLQAAIAHRLPAFTALVADDRDYARYSPDRRRRVATMVGLVTTAVAMTAAPLDEDTGEVVSAARRRLGELARHAEPVPTRVPSSSAR